MKALALPNKHPNTQSSKNAVFGEVEISNNHMGSRPSVESPYNDTRKRNEDGQNKSKHITVTA